MRVDFSQNVDTSSGFTTGNFPGTCRPLGVSGYNPDGPRWDCSVALSVWNTALGAVVTHTFEYGGRNGQMFKFPSWWNAILVSGTATPTAQDMTQIAVAMRGNAIGRLHYLFPA